MLPHTRFLHFVDFQFDESMKDGLLTFVRILDGARKALKSGTCSRSLVAALDHKEFWSDEEDRKSDEESYKGSQVRVEADIFQHRGAPKVNPIHMRVCASN